MIRILRAALAQRLAITTVVLILTLAGAFVASVLPEGLYPSLAFSRVNVHAELGDLPPSLVQTVLTRPLEGQLATLPGVKQVKALSTQGASDINVSFDPEQISGTLALQRVSTVVSAAQSSFPTGTPVHVTQITSNVFPVVTYALTSRTADLAHVRETAEFAIKPQLVGLPGIAAVSVLGGDTREFRVALDPQRLAAHGITIDDVTTAIAKTNTIAAVGHADAAHLRSTIIATGLAHDAATLERIPIASKDGTIVTVSSVATVTMTRAPRFVSAFSNQRRAVIVNVFPQPGASFVSVSQTIENALARIAPEHRDIAIVKFWDISTLVSASISSLRDAILLGLALSAIVLLFFLRDWRATLIAGVVIPLTIVISFAFMLLLGQGLNLMTLGGLAVGVGLVIDDAIVVVENINRHLGRGEDRRAGVLAAVAEIAGPMTSSTVTTIVVFAPLSLLSGVTGAFFQALSITLTIALVVSLVLAFLFTPNLATRFLRAKLEKHNPLVEGVQRRYLPLLHRSLQRPALVFAIAIGVFVATVAIGKTLGTDFLPALDERGFEMTYTLPPGTTLTETERVSGIIASIIDGDPAVARSGGIIGASLTALTTDTPAGTNGGTIRVTLRGKSFRSAGIRTVMDRIGERVAAAVPRVQFTNLQLLQDSLNDLSNQAAPIEVRLAGPDQTTLVPLATDIARRIASVPGIAGVFSGVTYHNPSIVVRAQPAASAFGVDAGRLATDEAVMFGGAVVSQVVRNPLTIPIRVRYDIPDNPTPRSLESLPYVTPSGAVQPLDRIASFTKAPPQTDIFEYNGTQYAGITAQIVGSNLGAIVDGIRAQLARIDLPPGYTFHIAGAYELQQESFRQFALAIGVSTALVFLVMVVQFRSFLQPIAILTAVPLSAFGAVVALAITHVTLNVSSLMGVILLVGLVVKNGILLLEYAAHHERLGESLDDALLSAARVRLRPILMTTLTALLGMVPLAFAFGSGSELLQPLAIVVIGGLSFSTLFTLILVPVFYKSLVALERRVTGRARATSKLPEMGTSANA